MTLTFSLAVLLCAPSHAVVVAPAARARAWAAPISGAMSAAGLDRLSTLGSVSLPRLAAPGPDGRVPALASPDQLDPLARMLEHRGLDQAAFAALSTEAKLEALGAAAKAVEQGLALSAAEYERRMQEAGVSRDGFPRLEEAVRQTRELSVYLDARAEASLTAAEKTIAARRRARAEALAAYTKELPKRMAAGFDGTTYAAREEDGARVVWRAADGHPDESFASAEALLESRVASLGEMRPGPWSLQEAGLLSAAVKHQRAVGGEQGRSWADGLLAAIDKQRARGVTAVSVGPAGAAADRFAAEERLRPADVIALERYYEGAIDMHPREWRERARVLATLETGGGGMPSWHELRDAKKTVRDRMQRIAAYAGAAWLAVMALMGLVQTLTSGMHPFLFILLAMSPVAVWAWAIWQRDSLSDSTYRLDHLRRYFS